MKQWYQRIISAILVLAAGVLVFSGCGRTGAAKVKLDPNHPVTVTLWHYYNGSQKEAFDRLITQFNETEGLEQGIVVEGISQGNVTSLMQKVMDAADKKVGAPAIPQMFAAYADTAYALDQKGLIASLDSYLTKEETGQYVESYLNEGRIGSDNQLKIFPVAKSTEVLMLNKTDWDKFAAATGAKTSDLSTMEGVTRTAKKYYEWTDAATEAKNDGRAFFGRDAMANYFIIGMKQMGIEMLSVENGTVHFNFDKTALRRLWDNYYVPFINGYFAANGKFRTDDAKTGDIIAVLGSTSGASYFPSKVTLANSTSYPVEAMVLPCPVFEGGEKIAVQQGAGFAVSKSTPEQEYASVQFLKWVTEKERNISFSASSGYLPVKKEASDTALIVKQLSSMPDSSTKNNLSKVLPVAVDTTREYTFYTNKVYKNANAVRDEVLETSMSSLAAQDAEKVRQAVKEGASRETAVAAYDNDAHFEEWYQQFVAAANREAQA